jgi:accessory gene regulator B
MKMDTYLLPHSISKRLAGLVVSAQPELKERQDEIRYGLEWIISAVFQIVFVSVLSLYLDVFVEAFFALLSGALLRMFIGGAHFLSYFKCTFYGTSILLLIALVSKHFADLFYNPSIYIGSLVIMFFIIFFRAPVLYKTKELFNEHKKRQFKWYSLLTFLLLFLFNELAIESLSYKVSLWMAILFQVFAITKIGGKVILFTDKITSINK